MSKRTHGLAALLGAVALGCGRGITIPHRTGKPSTPLTPEHLAEWHRTHATKKKAGNPNKRRGKR